MRLALLTALVLGAVALLPQDQDQDQARPAPEVGKAAPLARLNDHVGNAVAIGGEPDPAGTWTVLAFYPKALTGG